MPEGEQQKAERRQPADPSHKRIQCRKQYERHTADKRRGKKRRRFEIQRHPYVSQGADTAIKHSRRAGRFSAKMKRREERKRKRK